MSEREILSPLTASQLEQAALAVKTYQNQRSAHADMWLAERGLSEAAVDGFRLGEVAEPLPGHEKYRGMLAIPYLLHDGTAVTMRFRCMQEHNHREHSHGKYLSMFGDPGRVFNIGAVMSAGDEIHVTEGEFDTVILTECGLDAVGLPGATTWAPYMRRLFAGFSKVWVWADPDEAGAEMAGRLAKALPASRQVRLTEGDVNDTYLSKGRDGLLELIGSDA